MEARPPEGVGRPRFFCLGRDAVDRLRQPQAQPQEEPQAAHIYGARGPYHEH